VWILNYKGFFLHGYCDRPGVRITGVPHGTGTKECADLAAAKLYISKLI
jgi:hypothetical protein